ncbi:MAG: hypothetical protein AAF517_12360, partial [Planctomycetota bacterium]
MTDSSLRRLGLALLLACSPLSFAHDDGVSRPPIFVRGDVNADGQVDLSDPISALGCLFLGAVCPGCPDAADTNDDGSVDLSDSVFVLSWLFAGGTVPRPPSPSGQAYVAGDCGIDPTEDSIGCGVFAPCAAPPSVDLVFERSAYGVDDLVEGEVTVEVSGPFFGTVTFAFVGDNPDPIFEETHDVSTDHAEIQRIPISFAVDFPGRYQLHAILESGEDVVDATDLDIAIRGDLPREVPGDIHDAKIVEVDASALRDTLEESAGQATTVQFGDESFDVVLTFSDLLWDAGGENGAPPPIAIEDLQVYEGKCVEGGQVVEESFVVICAGFTGVFAMIQPNLEARTTMVEALEVYTDAADAGRHLVYTSDNVVPPPHNDPIDTPREEEDVDEALAGIAGLAGGDEDRAGVAGFVENCPERTEYVIPLHIYEHEVSEIRTQQRASIVAFWSVITKNEFLRVKGQVKAWGTGVIVDVTGVRVTGWTSISRTG